MATLATDTPRAYPLGHVEEHPVVATDIVYEGAAVGLEGAGYARPLVGGDVFAGFAEQQADNSTGSAGEKRVRVKSYGFIQLDVAGVTLANYAGQAVYALDDNDFTTASGLNRTLIGYVSRFVAPGVAVVEFGAALSRAATHA